MEGERQNEERREDDKKKQADHIGELPLSCCAPIAHSVGSGLPF